MVSDKKDEAPLPNAPDERLRPGSPEPAVQQPEAEPLKKAEQTPKVEEPNQAAPAKGAEPAKEAEGQKKAEQVKGPEVAQKRPPEDLLKEVQAPLLQLSDKIMQEFNTRLQGGIEVPRNPGRGEGEKRPWSKLGGQPAPVKEADKAQGGTIAANANAVGRVGERSHLNQASVILNIFNGYAVTGDFEKGFKAGEALGVPLQESENTTGQAQNSAGKTPDAPGEKIREELQSIAGDGAYVISARDRPGPERGKLPESEEEIESWYKQLNEAERCLVRTAAVLHGAPLPAISEATHELYMQIKSKPQAELPVPPAPQPVAEKAPTPPPATLTETLTRFFVWMHQEEQAASSPTPDQASPALPAKPDSIAMGSISNFLERTYLYTRRVKGATRLFWLDADEASGLSHFSTELLHFFSREVSFESMFTRSGQSFLDVIKQWPEKYHGELSWRSANALGVIWWYQDARTLLWTQATEWARGPRQQDWEHAAALLDGAFRVEQDAIWNDTERASSSSVIQLLNQWTNVAHQAKNRRGEGYATARAYALIGRKYPDVALKGLQHLLNFPFDEDITLEVADLQQNLFIAGIFKYIDIINSGHIRQVLAYLANCIEQPASGHLTFTFTDIRRERTNSQPNVSDLPIILAAFVLVSSCSLSGANPQANPGYSATEALPEFPACPSYEGKDILLAGLLTAAEEEVWQKQLAILLGALLMEKNDEYAFYLLSRWGEIVLKDTGPQAQALQDAYARFLLRIGQQLHIWLSERQPNRPIALGVYKRKLRLWLSDRRLYPRDKFQRLAEQVLQKLP